jgi:hypothetical protein
MNFWDILDLHKSKIFAILAIVFAFYWLSVPEDEPTQPVITLNYRCELIVKNSHEFPKNVIENCKKLLKEENEIE